VKLQPLYNIRLTKRGDFMAFNLQRDAKVYVSSVKTGFTPANTFEVRVMAGFQFNQTTETADVSVDEAGAAPARGSKRFNTKLNPSDLRFSTYIRPYIEGGNHNCPELILWEGLVGNSALGTNATPTPTGVGIDFNGSNVHELNKLYMFVDYGDIKYMIEEAVIGQARIAFDINNIAMIEWQAQGKIMQEVDVVTSATFPASGSFKPVPDCAQFIKNKLTTISLVGDYNKTRGSQVIDFAGTTTFTAGTAFGLSTNNYTFTVACDGGLPVTYTFAATPTSTVEDLAEFIADSICCATVEVNYTAKTITVRSKLYGTGSSVSIVGGTLITAIDALANFAVTINAAAAGTAASRTYNVPITGGEIVINNNITFLTPDELGVVNLPIGHFTGVRSVTGNLTAYLRSGSSTDAAQLIQDMVNSVLDTTAEFALNIYVGGAANTPRVRLQMPKAHISTPTIDTQDVISTTITFMGVPSDLDKTDELLIEYVAGTPAGALLVSP